MTFNSRLIVFDLDGTLICSAVKHCEPEHHRCIPIEVYGKQIYVYIRPHMEETLLKYDKDPRNLVMLYSSGDFEYVHTIVREVIYPLVRVSDPWFSFVSIFTRADMEDKMTKPIGRICKLLGLDRSILIDDMPCFCLSCDSPFYNISTFDPNDQEDDQLLVMISFLESRENTYDFY